MAEYVNTSAIGSWYFQAIPTAAKLSLMTNNARAAHWNKPRALRYRESARITTTQVQDLEQTHQVLLSGVRVIQGRTSPYPNLPFPANIIYADSEVHAGTWIGEPQVLFPTGQGLPPFVERPVVMCNLIAIELEKVAPDAAVQGTEPDATYDFVNWFGGLDWGASSATTPKGIQYDVNPLFTNARWPRCVIARPIPGTITGQAGASDTLIGLRFRLIFGRLGGAYDSPHVGISGWDHPGGYYIHWQAMGPVAAY